MGHFSTLLAIAFVAWAVTVALTPLRLRFLPDAAERIARALGAKERSRRSERLHRGLDADARSDAALVALALGCALAVAALAALAARADDAILSGRAGAAADALLGALVGLLALPFALVAASAARRAFHRRAREAALGPAKLSRAARDRSRLLAGVATVISLLVVLAAPALMLLALAPAEAVAALSAGALVGAIAISCRPSWLERLADSCEDLLRSRASGEPPDPRLHDFRGLSPFGYDVEALPVRSGTRAAWTTLRALAVPERTGARVVSVVRPGAKDGNVVGPATLLHPGDEVILGGSSTQIVAARRYLLEPSAPLEDHAASDDREVHADVAKAAGGPRVS